MQYDKGILPWLYTLDKPHLQVDEVALIENFGDLIRERHMLDIGIGAGRTTRYFAPIAGSYIGIDISPRMVAIARKRHPFLRIEIADAQDLSILDDGSVDFALFSNCGLDLSGPEQRFRILAEVLRVLRSGGHFAFCTHNRRFLPGCKPWSLSPLVEAKGIRNLAKRAAIWPIGIYNYLRLHRPDINGPDYTIVLDEGEGLYNHFVMYTSPPGSAERSRSSASGWWPCSTWRGDKSLRKRSTPARMSGSPVWRPKCDAANPSKARRTALHLSRSFCAPATRLPSEHRRCDQTVNCSRNRRSSSPCPGS